MIRTLAFAGATALLIVAAAPASAQYRPGRLPAPVPLTNSGASAPSTS